MQIIIIGLDGELGRFAGSAAVQRAISYAKSRNGVAAFCPDILEMPSNGGVYFERIVFVNKQYIPDNWTYFGDEDFTSQI